MDRQLRPSDRLVRATSRTRHVPPSTLDLERPARAVGCLPAHEAGGERTTTACEVWSHPFGWELGLPDRSAGGWQMSRAVLCQIQDIAAVDDRHDREGVELR